MAFTQQVRNWWIWYRCSPGQRRLGGFFGRGDTIWESGVYEQAILHDAVSALEEGHLGSGYVPSDDGFIGSRRWCPNGIAGQICQADGRGCSIHNYVAAYDIEYNYNKYIRTRIREEDFDEPWFPAVCKYTLEQVRAVEGIKNLEGEQMWMWLGWAIGDFMHWQINVPPERTQVDWNTVPGYTVDENMETILIAYVEGAFNAGNPNVTGNKDYWLNEVIPNPNRWGEFKDLFRASIAPTTEAGLSRGDSVTLV